VSATTERIRAVVDRMADRMLSATVLERFAIAIASTLLALLIGAAIVAASGYDPVEFVFSLDAGVFDRFLSGPEDVSLYRFNETRGAWVPAETQVIGRDDGRVVFSGVGDRFSEWTVAIQRPEFNVTETGIDVGTATTEDEIVIQVFVTNTGGTEGTYEADLLTNQEVVDTKEATVPEGGTVLVTFLRTFSRPGLYRVQVNDVPVGEVDISAESVTVTETATPRDERDGVFGPGFGVLSAVVGLSVLAYLRRRD